MLLWHARAWSSRFRFVSQLPNLERPTVRVTHLQGRGGEVPSSIIAALSATREAPAAHPRSADPVQTPQKAVAKRVQTTDPPLQPETHTPEREPQL